MKLLPHPRFLERHSGWFQLPKVCEAAFDPSLAAVDVRNLIARIRQASKEVGVSHVDTRRGASGTIRFVRAKDRAIHGPEYYALTIGGDGAVIEFCEAAGARAAVATLRQLLREYGRRLPCLGIRDWPDFARRGVMLDISRGRVPRLGTLLDLVGKLADFKINEFQLYTEHTFAYRKWRAVWKDWGALTGAEIRRLDARCRQLGIELVPNQNSFGHLREWLADPRLKKLGEVTEPWPDGGGAFLRRPSTLAPNHPGTLPFLRGLYDELLPNFTSRRFNVGCDEPWDLGRGQSRELCERIGKGRAYLRFLKKIHRELSARNRRMMFWGDIILRHPELIQELPRDVIALNWGYEADHPFDREAAMFRRAKIPFYVCPGTSTWMTLVGRHDNAFANLRRAAIAGKKHGAAGYLVTDWGDGGHPQPSAVSWLPLMFGAAAGWCVDTADEKLLAPVASRNIFLDSTGRAARAALALGMAHRKLKFSPPNRTSLGAVIAAPPPEQREVFCHGALTDYTHILEKNIRVAMRELEAQRAVLRGSRPDSEAARILVLELDLAARMAVQSCKFMLWQHATKNGRSAEARRFARHGVAELQQLERDFERYWRKRNKATSRKCAQFLRWRISDYSGE